MQSGMLVAGVSTSSMNSVISQEDNQGKYSKGAADPSCGAVLKGSNPTAGGSDAELPLIMASLKIRDTTHERIVNEVTAEDQNSPRIGTRRRGSSTPCVTQNRRCNLKPSKMDATDVETYYLNKKFQKPLARHLETIYEEPVIKRNNVHCMLGAKKSRKIVFSGITKAKAKKRKANVKKIIRNTVRERVSLTQEDFLTHLCALMLENVCEIKVNS